VTFGSSDPLDLPDLRDPPDLPSDGEALRQDVR
jgi:hypothetical protein